MRIGQPEVSGRRAHRCILTRVIEIAEELHHVLREPVCAGNVAPERPRCRRIASRRPTEAEVDPPGVEFRQCAK
jgi:hypothetical protein